MRDVSDFESWSRAQNLEILRVYKPANMIVLQMDRRDLVAKVLPRSDVIFADRIESRPREELPVPGHNLYVNHINVAHLRFPDLDGNGITVSIKEYRFDTADVDLKNRASTAPNVGPKVANAHANIMASLAGGAGNSDPAGLGVANGARLLTNGFNNLLPEDDYAEQQISVQNHSYGVDIENYYGAGALAYDKSVEENPALVHVFSAGNKGLETAPTGIYANLPGYANITGNFKMAKNVLTVGAVDSFGQLAPFSSHGPAYDGRMKPDLVAFGQDGSSGSAALVSGAAAVLQQVFSENSGMLPPASLVRAVLLNSADDIAPAGPDFLSGFGNLNLPGSIQTIEDQNYKIEKVNAGESLSFPVTLPAGVAQFKITLIWDDPAAAANALKSLVNDLDLKVLAPDGTEWLPWALNHSPYADSLRLPAVRRRDSLNNVEQVTVDFPAGGQYTLMVTGTAVQTMQQAFSLAWDWKPAHTFGWSFPVKNDPAVAGGDVLLRWQNTFGDTTGLLEYSFSDASGWHTIDSAAELAKGWYRWLVPDTFAEARVRMQVGGKKYTSDTFLISRPLRVKVGFNCPDSVFLYWNRAAPAARYLVSGLGEKYLEPLFLSSDTFAILPKPLFPQLRFSVTPVGPNGITGLRSAAPDIGTQGVGCYFQSLLAELNDDNRTDLRLTLGTRYGLRSVSIEKMENDTFIALKTWQPVENEEFEIVDMFPREGQNTYRARLELLNGATLFGDTVHIYFWIRDALLVFPNPAHQNSIEVLYNTVEKASFVLFDMQGRLILEKELDDLPTAVTLPAGIAKGAYPYFLRQNGRLRSGGILLAGF